MQKPSTSADCGTQSSRLMPEDEALKLMLDQVSPVSDVVDVDLANALNRVLAQPQISPVNVPPHDNSAMDGFAVRSADIVPGGITQLKITQRIPAGSPGTPLAEGSAARIFTGAPLPGGTDTVIMQEQCRYDDNQVTIQGPVTAGTHIRQIGEDITMGTEILGAGIKLRPQDIGLAAAVGIATLPVYRKINIAIFSTGDELADPGHSLESGKIYNSNRYMLTGLLQMLGCTIIDLGTVPDNQAATRTVLQQAAPRADLIITTGGVSVGEEDHVKAAVEELGQLELWRIALKPGKPLAYGKIDAAHFIGLPGNPVSAFITFCIIARPFILRLQGRTDYAPKTFRATADFAITNPINRREYLRARFDSTRNADTHVSVYPHQGSGVLTSATWANCLAVIPEQTTVTYGQQISVIPFSELFC